MTTCEDQARERPLLSLQLPPDPSCVGTARRRLRDALVELGRDDLVDDATLVVSELVTNALLHAGSEIAVIASYDVQGLLVQVTDQSPHVPLPRRYGDEARTGRGLHLIESLCDDWGYVRHAHGKTVWVRWSFGPESEPVRVHEPVPILPTPSTETTGEVVRVTLRALPILLHTAWRVHAQALLRDYLLATLGGDEDELAAVQVHADVTDAIAVLDEHLPRPVVPDHEGASLAGAVEPEVTLPVAVVPVPLASVPHFATLDEASDRALELADAGQLLTPPTLPEVRAFRRWVCAQVVDQAEGRPPVPFGVPWVERQVVELPAGWDDRPVTDADTGRVAADSQSRIVAISRPAVALLGYDDPAELIGRRLVTIIPRRLRQAHVAGMTMYLLADRRPLLDTTVTVPACRRDGTEVLVDLLIREEATATGRPVLVAEIQPAGD